ncbi:MAG TPA: hypothetical protein VNK46_02840 [Nitrospiraceae bacterium]|jgi:hypothetical protein|nr:hypothetical protein [Nitrospiraceae bacterium]
MQPDGTDQGMPGTGRVRRAKLTVRPEKRRLTLNLPADLLERLRNTVYWTPGLTMAKLVTDAVSDALDRLERRNGEPFPPRMEELKPGRPRRWKPVSEPIRPRIQTDNPAPRL